MKHEKIFKVEDGRIKITINYNEYHNKSEWRYVVETCEKGKRTWVGYDCTDWGYRAMSMEDRVLAENGWAIIIAGEDKILEVMNELYDNMKPKL